AKLGACGRFDGADEIFQLHLQYWLALSVAKLDAVERDIDFPGRGYDRVSVPLHGTFVEGVDRGGLSATSGGDDLSSHSLQRGHRAAGQKYAGTFAGEGASHGPADVAGGAVDDGDFVLQEHRIDPSGFRRTWPRSCRERRS